MAYINKEDLLEAISEPWKRVYEQCTYKPVDDLYRMIVKRINKAPAADVEPVRHGQWLMPLVDEPWQKGHHGRCSVCGKHYTYNVNKMPKRCDYCDAKMDGGKR